MAGKDSEMATCRTNKVKMTSIMVVALLEKNSVPLNMVGDTEEINFERSLRHIREI